MCYVLQLSNGLAAYRSGDASVAAEQDLVVRRVFKVNMAVINIGGTFTTGPIEAAYVINEWVKPKSVLISHANEPVTQDSKLRPETKTEAFRKATTVPSHLSVSGRTMEFGGTGSCIAGC